MKVLIVYYSRTGRTESVATQIAETLLYNKHQVTSINLTPKVTENFFLGCVLAGITNKHRNEIEFSTTELDCKPYKLIFIGTPVWVNRPVPVVRNWLELAKNLTNKKVGIFVTYRLTSHATINELTRILKRKGADVISTFVLNKISKQIRIVIESVNKLTSAICSLHLI